MGATIEAVLADKRAALERQLRDLSAPSADQGGISFGKRVGEGTNLAVERLSQVAAHDRLRSMLADVLRAQSKLAEGTLGVCEVCGKAITPERLDAVPWATRCVGCAT